MQVAPKIVALFEAMRVADLDALPPARRRQFADLCRHWADLAERRPPKSAAGTFPAGILADLRQGDRAE